MGSESLNSSLSKAPCTSGNIMSVVHPVSINTLALKPSICIYPLRVLGPSNVLIGNLPGLGSRQARLLNTKFGSIAAVTVLNSLVMALFNDQHRLPVGFFGLPVPVPAKTHTHSTGMGFSRVYPQFLQGFAGMYGSAGI